MGFAYPVQKFQDWLSQQWVILWGKKINHEDFQWLMGPFGRSDGDMDTFINQLAKDEDLTIERNAKSRGLIPSIEMLKLSEAELARLSQRVIGFYENTANYDLEFSVNWNSPFKFLGTLVNKLFSERINQLNIPTENIPNAEVLTSEIIVLSNPISREAKYTIWLRTFKSSGKILYSGVYGTCTLPSGKTCVKATFPLPNGNATVIMSPSVGSNGELVLESSGKNLGDAGFYFLVEDAKGNYWTQYIKSFCDRLVVFAEPDFLSAEQTLTLWNKRVLQFKYILRLKK